MLDFVLLCAFLTITTVLLHPFVNSALFVVLAAGWTNSVVISSWFIATHAAALIDSDRDKAS